MTEEHIIKTCDECESEYYAHTSRMVNLCAECAHVLYGHENCMHEFKEGRCIKCFWNGKSSKFIQQTKNK